MLCKVDEVNFLSGPGRGVILIKLSSSDDRVLGFIASTGDRDLLTVETSRGAEQTISTTKYEVTGRGGKGRELLQRGQFTKVVVAAARGPAAAVGVDGGDSVHHRVNGDSGERTNHGLRRITRIDTNAPNNPERLKTRVRHGGSRSSRAKRE